MTGDETKLDFMIIRLKDDKGLSENSGNEDGDEQINSHSIRY